MTESIGESLRKLRINHSKKLSQDKVAEKIGVSLSTYSRLENNEAELEMSVALKLADLYKVTVDELLHFADPDYKASEPKYSYQKRWTVPVMVALDGTSETLEKWINKLTAINGAL